MRIVGRPFLQYGVFRVAEAWCDFYGVIQRTSFVEVEHNSLCLYSAGNDFFPEVIVEEVHQGYDSNQGARESLLAVEVDFPEGNICVRDALGEICSEILRIEPGSYAAYVECTGRDQAVGYQDFGIDDESGELVYGDPVERWSIKLERIDRT